MLKYLLIIVGISIFLFSACTEQDDFQGQIVGDVTLFDTRGDAVEQQDGVEITATNGERIFTTITNTDGGFTMSLPLGKYTFQVGKENFGGITDFIFENTTEVDSMFFLELAEAPPVKLTISPAYGTYGHLIFIEGEQNIENHYLIGKQFYISSSPDVSSEKYENEWERCCSSTLLYELTQVGVKNEDLLNMGYKTGDVLYVTLYPFNYKKMFYFDPYDAESEARVFASYGKQTNVVSVTVQ